MTIPQIISRLKEKPWYIKTCTALSFQQENHYPRTCLYELRLECFNYLLETSNPKRLKYAIPQVCNEIIPYARKWLLDPTDTNTLEVLENLGDRCTKVLDDLRKEMGHFRPCRAWTLTVEARQLAWRAMWENSFLREVYLGSVHRSKHPQYVKYMADTFADILERLLYDRQRLLDISSQRLGYLTEMLATWEKHCGDLSIY